MADLSVAIDVQRVRATEGEKASELYAASHQAGTKWTDEQRKAIQASSAELAKWTQKADENVRKQREQADALKDLTEAARKFRDEATLTTETAGMVIASAAGSTRRNRSSVFLLKRTEALRPSHSGRLPSMTWIRNTRL